MELIIFKLFFCSIIGVLVGNCIYIRYKNKRLYYEEMLNLINRITSDLSFSQSKISDLLSSANEDKSETFNTHRNEFMRVINGEKIELSKFNFTSEEYDEISDFFASLGTCDLQTQQAQLHHYKEKFSARYNYAKSNEEKRGKPSLKLGLFIGLAVGIVIL